MTPERLKKSIELFEEIKRTKTRIKEIEESVASGGLLSICHSSRGSKPFILSKEMESSVVEQCLLRMRYDLQQLEYEFKKL